jgi:hypothetical protein
VRGTRGGGCRFLGRGGAGQRAGGLPSTDGLRGGEPTVVATGRSAWWQRGRELEEGEAVGLD